MCPSAAPPSNRAGPIDRAGLTEVPSSGIPTRWMTVKVSPIARPAKPGAAASEGDQEHDQHKEEGENGFDDQSAAGIGNAVGAAPIVGAAAAGLVLDLPTFRTRWISAAPMMPPRICEIQ